MSSPWRRAWKPTPVFLLGECHGQRSLAGYSPWSNNELDMTEATEQLLISLRSLNVVSLGSSRDPENFRRRMAWWAAYSHLTSVEILLWNHARWIHQNCPDILIFGWLRLVLQTRALQSICLSLSSPWHPHIPRGRPRAKTMGQFLIQRKIHKCIPNQSQKGKKTEKRVWLLGWKERHRYWTEILNNHSLNHG